MADKPKILYPEIFLNRKMPANLIEEDFPLFEKVINKKLDAVKLYIFNDINVTPEGIVFKHLYPKKQFLIYPYHTKTYKPLYVLSTRVKRKKITLAKNEKYLLCFDYWSVGYFHWMCDVLPRLQAVKKMSKDFVFLIPEHFTSDFFLETLKAFNLKSVHKFSVNTYLNCSQLFVPEQITVSGEINPENFLGLRDTLLKYFKPQFKNESNHQNIYISRKKAKYRKILNEEEVIECVKKYNFKIICYEDYSIKQQFEIAYNAKNMVSLHGANLVNAMFMEPNGNVLEFRKENDDHNNFFYSITDSVNCNYYYLNCKYYNAKSFEYFDLEVNIEKLDQLLKEIIHN